MVASAGDIDTEVGFGVGGVVVGVGLVVGGGVTVTVAVTVGAGGGVAVTVTVGAGPAHPANNNNIVRMELARIKSTLFLDVSDLLRETVYIFKQPRYEFPPLHQINGEPRLSSIIMYQAPCIVKVFLMCLY